MIATEKTRTHWRHSGHELEGTATTSRFGVFGVWQTFSFVPFLPHGWTEEPYEPVEPFTDQELWEAEGCPTHVLIDGYPCEVDGHEQPETLPEETPGVPEPLAAPARHSVRSEVADGIVLTGYAHCTFDEFPDLTPDDREDIRQELAAGLCAMADRAIASGKTPRIRRDILRLTRDRLVAKKRKENAACPSVAVADENAAAEAREALESERLARQANAWRLHLVEMERLRQQTPALSGTRLL